MENKFLERVGQLQAELKAPKGQTNKFGGYKYRSCEDILEAVKPLLQKHRLVLTVGDELMNCGDRYYVCATATLRDMDGDDFMTNSAYAREASEKKGMDEAQVTGTASSYARKYALNGLFCIDDTKDPDTNEYTERTRDHSRKRETPLYCSDCRTQLVDGVKRDGTPWPVADIIAYSTGRFGRQLCPVCQKKSFAAEKAAGQ